MNLKGLFAGPPPPGPTLPAIMEGASWEGERLPATREAGPPLLCLSIIVFSIEGLFSASSVISSLPERSGLALPFGGLIGGACSKHLKLG